MQNRDHAMHLLQEENELNEIVQLVGKDSLSPNDQLTLEITRMLREDFLQQNAFLENDQYSSFDRQARLLVSNPGDPIPPDQLGRLFERFYRADASRGEQSGFGLGLPIAASIATEHKGTLKAESDQASTRFLFSMPLKK